MKYVLGFLFEYKYYKNPANVRIFANNQLIDEFELTEDINLKNIKPPTADDGADLYNFSKKWTTVYQFVKQLPEKAFVYTLDESIIKNSIRIEITNNNTNYTNGFMTKWSFFKFHSIFLLPTYYLDVKNFIAFGEKQIQIRKNLPDQHDEYDDSMQYHLRWPDEDRVVKNNCFIDSYTNDKDLWYQWEKGGSFSIKLPIIDYIYEEGLKMLGPINYEQLEEKEKRRIFTSAKMPLYFKCLKLINTKNETT